MNSDFSKRLALLRREQGRSQRQAAEELQVSQALLSHYENGQREPGLAFVVRAADYYGVSTDFLLGRSFSRDGGTVSADLLPDASKEKGNVLSGSVATLLHKKMVLNSTAMLFDLCDKFQSKMLTGEVAHYLALALYKVFRYCYASSGANPDTAFRASDEQFDYLCDAEMRMTELRMRLLTQGESGFGVPKEEKIAPQLLDLEGLSKAYPTQSQSLFTMLQTVTDRLGGLISVEPKKKKRKK